jgi:hypothetical protein
MLLIEIIALNYIVEMRLAKNGASGRIGSVSCDRTDADVGTFLLHSGGIVQFNVRIA